MKIMVAGYQKEIERLNAVLERIRSGKKLLSFDSLRPGGILNRNVKDFTYFPSYEANEAFLEVINYAEGTEGACEAGDGLCECLARYTKLSIEERKKFAEITGEDECQEGISENHASGHRQGKLDYKSEYLVYNIYVHCGWTERLIAPLFDVSPMTVHNIIYAWANLMNDVLSAWFPTPTRSQLLRSYPNSLFQKWGDCRVHSIYDACEVWANDASRMAVHAALFSTYKNHPTLKFLAGCDGIGTTWADAIPDGFPGAFSDPMLSKITKMLLKIPYGMVAELDKGFVVDNEAAVVGVGVNRPQKMLRSQVQQAAEDTVHTEKVGHTRIPIEQLNGASKAAFRYFRGSVPLLQLGLASLLFRVSYLMQNFKYGFTQGRSGGLDESRPCKAEVRWYSEMEEGLFDARPFSKLWATKTEERRWDELRQEHPHATDTAISEMVLAENIPARLRREHMAKLDAMTSHQCNLE